MYSLRSHSCSRIGIVHEGNFGDIIAILPMAGILKAALPNCTTVFIGRRYGREIALASHHIDEFLDADAVREDTAALAAAQLDILLNPFPYRTIARTAARARIPVRVGNLRRGAYARWCNRFVAYGRAKSGLHEAVLNLRELRALGVYAPSLTGKDMPGLCGLVRLQPLSPEVRALFATNHFHLLLHTKSNMNGREWPLAHFLALAEALQPYPVQIFLTGTAQEGEVVRAECPALIGRPEVVDTFGRFSTGELLSFIGAADGVIGAGTGPVHIAAALGKHALGIYPPLKSISAKRWSPLGPNGEALQAGTSCPAPCKWHEDCRCMKAITPQLVADRVVHWMAQAKIAPNGDRSVGKRRLRNLPADIDAGHWSEAPRELGTEGEGEVVTPPQ
jgi:ADP-heptose:LPS heptosyltransferase